MTFRSYITLFFICISCLLFSEESEMFQAKELDQKDYYLLKSVKFVDIALKYRAEMDSLSPLPSEVPFLVHSPQSKVFLANGVNAEEFKKIKAYSVFLYSNIAYRDYPWGLLSAHTDYQYEYQGQKLPAIYVDSLKWNLSKENPEQNMKLILFLSEQIYQHFFRMNYTSYPQLPDRQYPLLDEENRALATLEMNLLTKAWEKSLVEDNEQCLEYLKQFYVLRKSRWTKNRSFIMPFEQNEEIRLGYSAYQSHELIQYFREYQDSLSYKEEINYFRKNFAMTIPLINQYDDLAKLYKDNALSIHRMTADRLRMSGMMQLMIFKQLDWKIEEMNRRDLWYMLNDKIVLSDSLEKAMLSQLLEDDLYKEIILQVKEQNEAYQKIYQVYDGLHQQNNARRFILNFDHQVDEITAYDHLEYRMDEGKIRILPNTKKYALRSPWITFNSKNLSFKKIYENRNKKLQWKSNEPIEIFADQTSIPLSDSLKREFQHLVIHSKDFDLTIESPGSLQISQNEVILSLMPRIRYFTDEEWWQKLDDLSFKLMQKGVPVDWFVNQVNHPDFKVYLSMKRYFTSMPEHRVQRGEVTLDAYMKNFGVDQKVLRGDEFIDKYQKVLEKAERKNGIHYELIMAILAIESDYGNSRFKGTFYTFPALVSQYLLLPRRERFALNELDALYKFSKLTQKDPYHFIGSYAGAAGWGQFIPSSMNAFFLDSENLFSDIDIYSLEDNIVSIENYLFKNGLSKKNIDNEESRYKAVYSYNHSDSYVKTVLFMYDQLRAKRFNKIRPEPFIE